MFFLNECVLQDVRAEISGFLQQLRFEVMRKLFNAAALQCELHLGSQIGQPTQVAKAGEQLGVPALVCWCWASLTYIAVFPPLHASQEPVGGIC